MYLTFYQTFLRSSTILLKGDVTNVAVDFTKNVISLGSSTLYLASVILLLYLVFLTNVDYGKFYTIVKSNHLRSVIEEGVGILPKRVHMDDSYSISLDLTLSDDLMRRSSFENPLYKSNDYLEAEIRAVGLEVDGEKRVQIYETSQIPVTTWNCRFTESGTHTINLQIYSVKPHNNLRDLIFMHDHDVKVSSLLTVSSEPVLALVTSILVAVIQSLLTHK